MESITHVNSSFYAAFFQAGFPACKIDAGSSHSRSQQAHRQLLCYALWAWKRKRLFSGLAWWSCRDFSPVYGCSLIWPGCWPGARQAGAEQEEGGAAAKPAGNSRKQAHGMAKSCLQQLVWPRASANMQRHRLVAPLGQTDSSHTLGTGARPARQAANSGFALP